MKYIQVSPEQLSLEFNDKDLKPDLCKRWYINSYGSLAGLMLNFKNLSPPHYSLLKRKSCFLPIFNII